MKVLLCVLCVIAVTACKYSAKKLEAVSEPPPSSPIENDPVSTTFIYRLDTAGEKIYLASLDPATGELHEHEAFDMPPGSQPTSFTVTPDKKYLFVSAFNLETIEAYEIDETTGELMWTRSNDTYDFPATKVLVEPQGDFLVTVENIGVPGMLTAYLVGYGINNDTLTALNHISLGQIGDKLGSDLTGDNYFVGSNDSGIMAIKLDRTSNPGIPLFAKSNIYGSFLNDFSYSAATEQIFTANTINGDFNLVLFYDPGTITLTPDVTLNAGQMSPFDAVRTNSAGDNVYYLSSSPPKINAFSVTYTPTAISLLSTTNLTAGCAPEAMTFTVSEEFLITGCTDTSGQTFSLEVEPNGSLTLKDTTVRSGMKINDILIVTF